jgi:thioester reductase-like protein
VRTELIRPLPELLSSHADHFGDKIAFRDVRKSVSYADLERRTRRLAARLAELGLARGDRAAIYLGNRVEVVECYLGITRAGAVGVPLNPRASDPELAHFLADSDARVVLTDLAHLDQLGRVLGEHRRAAVVVVGGQPGDAGLCYEDLLVTEPDTRARDDLGLDEPAWMLYTSGTTGRAKGVLSTQRSCLWSIAACYSPILGLDRETTMLWPAPLFHSLAHVLCVLGVPTVGATAHIMDGFSAEDVLTALRSEPYTFLAGVPTMYHYLVRAAEEQGADAHSLRTCLTAGTVCPAALRESFQRVFGVPLLDGYGATETCGLMTASGPDDVAVPGSCGRPVPGLDVRVMDPGTGTEVATGEEGEIWASGPSVMLGYHNRPEATAEALRDGWYRTGDLARQAESGHLFITGRIKELIIRAGENIHPTELEDVLRRVPGVADVAVTGKPHDVLGEVPVAFVVPDGDGPDPERLLAVCRERLSYFKVPEEVYEIDSVPRTASGKTIRHVLWDRAGRLRVTTASSHASLTVSDRDGPAVLPVDRLAGMPAAERETVLLDAVLTQVRAVLGTAEAGGRPFTEFGLSSVSALDLRNRLTAMTGLRLSPTVAFDHPTPLALAAHLSASLPGTGAANPSTIGALPVAMEDFEAEVELPDDVRPAADVRRTAADPGNVFLTGATGFLGAFLLRDLMRATAARVHCLVRASDEAAALARIRTNLKWYGIADAVDESRISVVLGDLVRSRLGLSEDEFDALAGTVDVVYHAGAQVNWLYPYAMLKPANVSGTKEVLRLAARHRTIPVHYVSSIGVFADSVGDGISLKTDDMTGPAEKLPNGYRQSKWVAERIVTLAQARGLPVTVYRAGVVSGDQVRGACQVNDFVWRSLKGCLRAKAVPEDAAAVFTMVPVDYVSAAIVNLSANPDSVGRTFHLDNRETVTLDAMVEYLRAGGYPLKSVPRKAFNDIVESDRDNALFPILDIFDGLRSTNEGYYLSVDVSDTERALAGTGIECPDISEQLFGTYVRFFVAAGYFPEPATVGRP